MLLDFVLSKVSPKTALKPKVEVEVEWAKFLISLVKLIHQEK
jgi:hypothetical protein